VRGRESWHRLLRCVRAEIYAQVFRTVLAHLLALRPSIQAPSRELLGFQSVHRKVTEKEVTAATKHTRFSSESVTLTTQAVPQLVNRIESAQSSSNDKGVECCAALHLTSSPTASGGQHVSAWSVTTCCETPVSF
jgi:hypothetical protein